jgi:hypothetical protein
MALAAAAPDCRSRAPPAAQWELREQDLRKLTEILAKINILENELWGASFR